MIRVRVLLLFALLLGLCAPWAASAGAPPVVWVDQGHGQAFRIDREGDLQLSALAQVLASEGLVVKSGRQELDRERLQGVSALLISGAFQPCSPEEIAAIHSFVNDGGRLVVLLHTAPPLGDLLFRFGIDFANGVIRDPRQAIDGEPLNFTVTRLARHPLTRQLREISLFGVWALTNLDERASIIASSDPFSWIDLNGDRRLNRGDAVQAFGVLVGGTLGRGEFVVFGDDALFQNRFIDRNRQLAVNLARWLAGRDTASSVAALDR